MTVKKGEGMGHHTRKDILHTFQMNFFAMSFLNNFPWDSLHIEIMTKTTSDIIVDILQKTRLHPICLKNPPSLKYRRHFLTELIKRMFAAEPLDVLYEALGEVMCALEEDMCYKTYLLVSLITLALDLRDIYTLTGLITVSLERSEWAVEKTHIFTNKTVLELGSGIGLTGYIFSDRHQTVLQRLKDNITNCLTNCDSNSASVCVKELDWEKVSDEQLQRIQASTIIAAVTYIIYFHSMIKRSMNHMYDCFKKELGRFYIINNILLCYTVDVKFAVLFNKWQDVMVPVLIPALLPAFPEILPEDAQFPLITREV
uniref:Eukaryotic elongation factor 2 lysine methyltransferase n=1 Tax=Cyprinus carpio TaxID=7962 RepID=A0A8C1KJE5_CYPCA